MAVLILELFVGAKILNQAILKIRVKNLFLLPALIAGLGFMPVGRAAAQTFMNLHSFIHSDGANPQSGLVLSGNTLYGTTPFGGDSVGGTVSAVGTVFKVNTDGTGFTNLYTFTGGSHGQYPNAVILSGDTLYGTTYDGGPSYGFYGTVFSIKTNGTSFTVLHSFTALRPYPAAQMNSDGAEPIAGLILSSNKLYGTTYFGGSFGNGTLFAVNTNGTGFTNLHSFTARNNSTNSDGANPQAGLILSGNTLYGTASQGGSSGKGTVFAINTDGTGFTNIYSFTTNDGSLPQTDLIISSNTLYGTTKSGGSSGVGSVFKLNTDGIGFTNLYSFTTFSGYLPTLPYPTYTNSDGASPYAGLILSGNTLYGTANAGGSSGNGTVFAVNTDGIGFANLYNFTALGSIYGPNSDGALPYANLILSGNTLYGTTDEGGSSGNGTVFSLSFAPQLTIIPSGTNVVLMWPTNVAGFDYSRFTLQSTTNLISPAVWSTNLPLPVVVNGQNTVTNSISGT